MTPFSVLLHTPVYALAFVGAAALALGGMLAAPLRQPPVFAPILEGAQKIDRAGKPELTRFQARDGSWLAYRFYAAQGADTGRIAILVHGSSALSDEMNSIAKSMAAAGVTAVAVDMRGHGASGGRGDIAYTGQTEDDLADLVKRLRQEKPGARFALVGHSLGGGFAARISATPVGREFERFVLVAPFLGPQAPSSGEGNKSWASVDLPRIIALGVLRRFGLPFGESLPVIAYANDPADSQYLTSVYSFRLLADFGPDFDWGKTKAALAASAPKISVVAGGDDELMDSAAYPRELTPLGVSVTVLPGVNHMGTVNDPAARAAIVEAVNAAPRS